jgi:hypothetical protein
MEGLTIQFIPMMPEKEISRLEMHQRERGYRGCRSDYEDRRSNTNPTGAAARYAAFQVDQSPECPPEDDPLRFAFSPEHEVSGTVGVRLVFSNPSSTPITHGHLDGLRRMQDLA